MSNYGYSSNRRTNNLNRGGYSLNNANAGGGTLGGAVRNHIENGINKMENVLNSMQLKNLTEHKYSSQGNTLLDPLFQPYWRWLVEQVPMNVAPNLLTIIGLIINIVSSVILMLYSPNATDDLPAWALILCSFGLFAYQSLDAIDGKQARRTNSSTPLGELFDHGCDAISTVFVAIAMGTSLKYGLSPWLMLFMTFTGMSAFYIAHWQTYVTGTLTFGKIDVTEAQLTIYIIYFLTAIFGDTLWSLRIPMIDIELRYVPAIVAVIGPLNSILSNIKAISRGGKGRNGASVADTSIVFPVVPLTLFLALAVAIARKSPQDVFVSNTCLYILAFGIAWSQITIKLIVAHMTKGEITMFDPCYLGPLVLLLNQYFGIIIPEYYALWLCLFFESFYLIKYCSKVCLQICKHMNIYLFKISPVISSKNSENPTTSTTTQPTMTTRYQLQQQQQQQAAQARKSN